MQRPDAVEGKPASKKKTVKKEPDNGMLKEKTSMYEPDPVTFPLPSRNLFIPDVYLTDKKEIYMRRLTSVEEELFKRGIEKPDDMPVLMRQILDACIKTNISADKLSLIDKIPAFIFLLAITYKRKIDFELFCEHCYAKSIEAYAKSEDERDKPKAVKITGFDLIKDLKVKYVPAKYVYPKELHLTSYKDKGADITIVVNFAAIEDEYALINDEFTLIEQTMRLLKDASGINPDGTPVTKENWVDIVTNLNDDDKIEIRKFFDEFGEFGFDLKTDKMVCQNKKCHKFDEQQAVDIPLDIIMTATMQ